MASYFVDPSIAGNSGAGTIGDPYGDLQYALDSVTRDTSVGDKFNIKSGTAEVLSAALDFTTYGTTDYLAGITFQGYDAAEDDGGRGAIDCNGNSCYTGAVMEGMIWYNLDISNYGTGICLSLDKRCHVSRCSISDGDGTALVMSTQSSATFNHIYDSGGGIFTTNVNGDDTQFVSNFLHDSGSRAMTVGLAYGDAIGNILAITSGEGIRAYRYATVVGNSILSTDGTGSKGIDGNRALYLDNVSHNLIEGFTTGISVGSTVSEWGYTLLHNAFYDCTTNISTHGEHYVDYDNESLGASPFAKSGALSLANLATYFAPEDLGNVRSAGWPVPRQKGAILPPAAGGGSGASSYSFFS